MDVSNRLRSPHRCKSSLALALLATALMFASIGVCAKRPTESQPLRLLVVTGGHDYEEAAFDRVFNEMENVSWSHVRFGQDAEAKLKPESEGSYDVAVFYDMHQTHESHYEDWLKANRDAFLYRPDGLFLIASEGLIAETRSEGTQRLFRTEPRGSNVQSFRFRIGVQRGRASDWKRFGEEFSLPRTLRSSKRPTYLASNLSSP